jgi:hypothetical protein
VIHKNFTPENEAKPVSATAIAKAKLTLLVAIFVTFTVNLGLRVRCQFDSLSRLN